MKYILDEEEMVEIRQLRTKAESIPNLKELQKFCTTYADTVPTHTNWTGNRVPWGCVLSTDIEWYCDDCPVQKICPNKYKNWSK